MFSFRAGDFENFPAEAEGLNQKDMQGSVTAVRLVPQLSLVM